MSSLAVGKGKGKRKSRGKRGREDEVAHAPTAKSASYAGSRAKGSGAKSKSGIFLDEMGPFEDGGFADEYEEEDFADDGEGDACMVGTEGDSDGDEGLDAAAVQKQLLDQAREEELEGKERIFRPGVDTLQQGEMYVFDVSLRVYLCLTHLHTTQS